MSDPYLGCVFWWEDTAQGQTNGVVEDAETMEIEATSDQPQ